VVAPYGPPPLLYPILPHPAALELTMPFGLKLLAPPSVEPVTVEIAKSHLRLEPAFTDDDALLGVYIMAARQYVEGHTHRAIYSQQWLMTLDYFPWYNFSGTAPTGSRSDAVLASFWRGLEIKLPKPTCVSVDLITYTDTDGNVVTVPPSAYCVDVVSEPARIVPIAGSFWPTAPQYLPGSVQITFTAGTYGDGVDVNNCPSTIRLAMLLLIAHWYEHREVVSEQALKQVPLAVDSLLESEMFTAFTLESN